MRYMFLIYSSHVEESQITEAEVKQVYEAHMRFGEEARARGVMVGGEELHPTTMATTVRRRDGQTLTTDGPYAETKEQLGGYYILDCKDLDEALEMAAMIPSSGCIEVRPIVDHG